MSEHAGRSVSRLVGKPVLGRALSQSAPTPQKRSPETLMMGYAQLFGSFTLDGSLVNEAPFEDVKRRAVVGGQGGGGVVGLERPKGDSGLFGALSWNSIGESLGGLLGSDELSSIKEMKGIAQSSRIPLLSTPKSILFVDLKLAPGDSRSYSYSFPLPRGLPPSHRGRAMKVSYNLIIGTQRPAFAGNPHQNITQVEVAFRVFGGVNAQGETLGHDLMSPYIILKDQAITAALDDSIPAYTYASTRQKPPQQSSSADFDSYVTHLLTKPRQNSTSALLSPSADLDDKQRPYPTSTSLSEAPTSTRSLVDLAIRLTTHSSNPGQSTTHFTIRRASIPIATLNLSRPALKLGDLLTVVIDFSSAQLPCYVIEATLESVETVDPTLALRSSASTERATRRIWGRSVESVPWCRRVVCAWQVPVGSTSTFSTTGVSVDWCVRVEFVIGSSSRGMLKELEREVAAEGATRDVEGSGSKGLSRAEYLLEEVSKDERGAVFAAAQRLPCESFEVAVPIKVFGAAVDYGRNGTGAEGLAV